MGIKRRESINQLLFIGCLQCDRIHKCEEDQNELWCLRTRTLFPSLGSKQSVSVWSKILRDSQVKILIFFKDLNKPKYTFFLLSFTLLFSSPKNSMINQLDHIYFIPNLKLLALDSMLIVFLKVWTCNSTPNWYVLSVSWNNFGLSLYHEVDLT